MSASADDSPSPTPALPREAHYRAKLVHRARGLDELTLRVGDVCADIDSRLARQPVVRILELGCGYGTALLELRARYRDRVELHGVNRWYRDGNQEILLRNATERGLPDADCPWPTIAYADVACGLPFADDGFDLVVSQVAWHYFGNKIGVLREVIRVLRADGIARIDADEVRAGLPHEYRRLVEIWRNGTLVPFGDYLQRFGMLLAETAQGQYLRFGKASAFGDDLLPAMEIDISTLHAHWDGIKCVYVGRPADPDGS